MMRLRPLVAGSWRRAFRAGVDPGRATPVMVHDDREAGARFESLLLARHLDLVAPLIEATRGGGGRLLVITAADGEIVMMRGGAAARRRGDRIGMAPGVLWTESSVGTNAIGTSISQRALVRIDGPEHFVMTHHEWTCVAAPITDPDSGELLGVIDLSGPVREFGPDTAALVGAVGQLIERQIAVERRAADARILADLFARPGAAGRVAAVLSPTGRLVWGSDDGQPAGECEHYEGYTVVTTGPGPSAAPGPVRLRLLGPGEPELSMNGRVTRLTQRRADLLALIARAPDGLSADALAEALYGDRGRPGTVRTEVHRARQSLGAALAGDPYRFTVPLSSDVGDVEGLLRRGDVRGAVRSYTGWLLPRSDALTIELLRQELHESVRAAAIAAGGQALREYCLGEPGGADYHAWARYVEQCAPGSAERAVADAHLNGLCRAAC
ncbi:GAF domain [Propionibacterium ruminifibrarum]|uniref:GAF domain n=2 Tax=Propionibacterium ruminifibrarum TaxID=1962131 RepID=A0A375I2P5_9ACTN|nr:GAF domain [Propionibacterium ruminifibrarum]